MNLRLKTALKKVTAAFFAAAMLVSAAPVDVLAKNSYYLKESAASPSASDNQNTKEGSSDSDKTTCEVHIQHSGNGTFWLNGEQNGYYGCFQKGSTVFLRFCGQQSADEHNRVAAVLINDEPMETDDLVDWSYTFVLNEDVTINVRFKEYDVATFHYDDTKMYFQDVDGNVIENGDKVRVNRWNYTDIVAVPKDGYEISSVLGDGNVLHRELNGYYRLTYKNKDYEVTAKTKTRYMSLTAESTAGGKITLPSANIEYGSSATIYVTVQDGYYLKSLTINGKPYTEYAIYQDGVLTIASVKEDLHFQFEFQAGTTEDALYNWIKVQEVDADGNPRPVAVLAEDTMQHTYTINQGDGMIWTTEADGIALIDAEGELLGGGMDIQSVMLDTVPEDVTVRMFSSKDLAIGEKIHIYNLPYHIQFYDGADIQLTTKDNAANQVYSNDVPLRLVCNYLSDNFPRITEASYVVSANGRETGHGDVDLETMQFSVPVKGNDGTVTIKVTAKDSYGNEFSTPELNVLVNSTPPTVETLSVSGTPNGGAESHYFQEKRELKLMIRDVDFAWKQENVKIEAFYLPDRLLTVSEEKEVEAWRSGAVSDANASRFVLDHVVNLSDHLVWTVNHFDMSVHYATMYFDKEGVYAWRLRYENRSGLSCNEVCVAKPVTETEETETSDDTSAAEDSDETDENTEEPTEKEKVNIAPFYFVIDWTAPTAEMEAPESLNGDWKTRLWERLSFMLFGKDIVEKVRAINVEDALSGVKNNISYYKQKFTMDEDTALTLEELNTLYADKKFMTTAYSLAPDEKVCIYARLEDNAGNVSYISTDGIIIENDHPEFIRLHPNFDTENIMNEFLRQTTVDVSVTDNPDTNESGIFSGIKTVRAYFLLGAEGRQKNAGVLYQWQEGETPKESFFGTIPIDIHDPELNEDYVILWVYAEDMAGNRFEQKCPMSINTDKPNGTVDFTFTGGDGHAIHQQDPYHQGQATATITLKEERESAFNRTAAESAIRSALYSEETEKLANELKIGEWKYDEDTHTYTTEVVLTEDANYSWKEVSFQDRAGHKVTIKPQSNAENSVKLEGGTAYFTIDNHNPEGKLSNGFTFWEKLMNVLTFGWYAKQMKAFRFEAEATDATSPYYIEYYIDSGKGENGDLPFCLSEADLSQKQWKEYTEPFSVEEDSIYVVYLRISDYAGNYIYISSEGHIIDTSPCDITFTSAVDGTGDRVKQVGAEYSGKTLDISVMIQDAQPSAGIHSVRYQITDGGHPAETAEWVTLLEAPMGAPYEELLHEVEETIVLDTTKYNRSDVKVTVEVADGADNIRQEDYCLDVDVTAPQISLAYDNNNVANIDGERGYFGSPRTAVITITERSQHFNAQKAAEGISVTCTDGAGNPIAMPMLNLHWSDVYNADNPDLDTHTAEIAYSADGNYTFSIAYTDEAGNANAKVQTEAVTPYQFTVDTAKPRAAVKAVSNEGRECEWDVLIPGAKLFFGFWAKERISISETHADDTSPIVSVSYYKTVGDAAANPLSESDLSTVLQWKKYEPFDILPNEQCVVYFRVEDYAGNVRYISTNGLIVDDKRPEEEMVTPEIALTPQQAESGIYNKDVVVSVHVTDPSVNGIYSGLKDVRYFVTNMDAETQNGVLFSFEKDEPQQADLKQTVEDTVIISSALNNSNAVNLIVEAVDNAGNTAREVLPLRIDTTAPVIHVMYDNNAASGDFFNSARSATIQITERNFDPKYVNVTVKHNGAETNPQLNWAQSGGTGNGDDTVWTAVLTFSGDGTYSFDITCTDMAGNVGTLQMANNTVNGGTFTIDQTAPSVTVVYDNNEAFNDIYYAAGRVATVTIVEHNFDPAAAMAGIQITAKNNGANVALPTIDGWTNNGDVHTTKIHFEKDAEYTFSIAFRDLAGNAATGYGPARFVIDTVTPSLKLTVNDSEKEAAYADKIVPVITYSDLNLKADAVQVTLNGVRVEVTETQEDGQRIFTLKSTEDSTLPTVQWHCAVADSEQPNGKVLTFTNFPTGTAMKAFDDIYTLSVSVEDKAGRVNSKTLRFSVNRYGSTYDTSAVDDLLGTYQKAPKDVEFSEINPTKLSDIQVTLFKNNETISLKQGQDYDLTEDGEAGAWYAYTYHLAESNFAEDGVYRIVVHSVDEAGNVSENTLDTKDTELSFGVDKTPPRVSATNLESNKTYAEDIYHVILSADDNLKLTKLTVKLDGDVAEEWDAEAISQHLSDSEDFSFEISGASTHAHNVTLIGVDAAGNETQVELSDIYVTTNLWVRFMNNRPLFFGVIIGIALLMALCVFMVIRKKKRA